MTPNSQVCIELLKVYFGPVVSQIGAILLKRGNRSFYEISVASGLSMNEVKFNIKLPLIVSYSSYNHGFLFYF